MSSPAAPIANPTGATSNPPPTSGPTAPRFITLSDAEFNDYGPDYPMVDVPNIDPAEFSDNFIILNESTLQALSLPELINYSTSISTSVGLEYSTIRANNKSIYKYTQLLQESDRIIRELNDIIFTNEIHHAASNLHLTSLKEEDEQYDILIKRYDKEIAENSKTVTDIQSTIDGLEVESDAYETYVERERESYRESTIKYTTLKSIYEGKKRVYNESVKNLSDLTTHLCTVSETEHVSYKRMIEKRQVWNDADIILRGLTNESIEISSEIVQWRIRVASAQDEYDTACRKASTLSTNWAAAYANFKYATSLSNLTRIVQEYATADSDFTTADIAYMNSLPTGASRGGGRNQQGGDQTLATTRAMALQQQQRLSTLVVQSRSAKESLQTIAGIAQTNNYDTMLIQYQDAIDRSRRAINTFSNIEKKSRSDVAYWSTLYDAASEDITTQTRLLKLYSTQYESSLIGNATIEEINNQMDRDYNLALNDYKTNSYILSSLIAQRASSISSAEGWFHISSLLKGDIDQADIKLAAIEEQYTQSKKLLDKFIQDEKDVEDQLKSDTADLIIQSTLLRDSEIELEDYLTSILDSVNNQEWSAYEYKQTYCQELSRALEGKYESLVLGAVQYASTQNGKNTSVSGVPVAPVPVNLNTVELSNAYLSLENINKFINSFETIFSEYDKQSSNIAAMSTSVGYEYLYWGNYKESSIARMNNTNTYTEGLLSTSLGVFQSSSKSFTDISGVVYSEIIAIGSLKKELFKVYSTFFTPQELAEQDRTISSFIIEGMEAAS